VFNQVVSRGIIDPAAEAVMPPIAKAIGAVSLIAWLGVLYFGRMLPALGDAF
jgi:hypothetical protein